MVRNRMIPTSMEQFINSMRLWLALQNAHLQGRSIPGVNFPNLDTERNNDEPEDHKSEEDESKDDKAEEDNFVGMMTNVEETNKEEEIHVVSSIGY